MEEFRVLHAFKRPLKFQFYLADFVDYEHADLENQVPQDGMGLYVPHAK